MHPARWCIIKKQEARIRMAEKSKPRGVSMNLQDIQKLIAMLEKSNLNELELETAGTKIRLAKATHTPAPALPPQFLMMPPAAALKFWSSFKNSNHFIFMITLIGDGRPGNLISSMIFCPGLSSSFIWRFIAAPAWLMELTLQRLMATLLPTTALASRPRG